MGSYPGPRDPESGLRHRVGNLSPGRAPRPSLECLGRAHQLCPDALDVPDSRTAIPDAGGGMGNSDFRGSAALQHGFIPLIKNISTLFVFVMGGIMVLKHFGYDVMSLLTALGVGSLAVGLAAKEALSNMISGFVLIMDGTFAAGDRISSGRDHGRRRGNRAPQHADSNGRGQHDDRSELRSREQSHHQSLGPSRASTCTTQIRVPYSADFERVSRSARRSCPESLRSTIPRTVGEPR